MAMDYYAKDDARMQKLAEMYNDDYDKMDSEIRDNILVAKAYLDPSMVDEFLKKYQEIADPEIKFDYLGAAAEIRDEEGLSKLMNLLGENDIVKPQDQLYLFIMLYRNPKTKAATFDWLIKNWETVRRINGDKSIDSYPTVLGHLARTETEYEKFRSLFEPMQDDSALKRAIEIGSNEIKARLELIKKHKEEVIKTIYNI